MANGDPLYSIYPRYTPGPAEHEVSEKHARHVALEERREYEWLRRNPSHPDYKKTGLGLSRIVVARWHAGKKLYTRDLLTGELSFRELRGHNDYVTGRNYGKEKT